MKKKVEFEYEEFETSHELSQAEQELMLEAKLVSKKAYAKYSSFHVGAAVRLEDGSIVCGNNQENIAFPSGLCAERTALFYAGANFPEKKVLALAIYAQGELIEDKGPVPPCGSCRQVMAETVARQGVPFVLLTMGKDGRVIRLENALDVLPFPFGM
jgi:cytidine deaminase